MSERGDMTLDFVRKTPLTFAPPLNCWLKLESLQATGSFKLRGAATKMARLPPEQRGRGVVTASAGNHGQGIGLAARRLGVPATVVIPELCPPVKRDAIARWGVELIVHGANYHAADLYAQALAKGRGVPYVSPFDDDDVIAGNGEWLGRELRDQHAHLSRVVAPIGGGGLISGLLRALPDVEVVGVQPRVNCGMHESLAQGRALVDYDGAPTLCEGLEGGVCERTFEIVRARQVHIALVDEDAILEAIGFAYRALGQVMEPSAAVVIAAARTGAVPTDEDTVLVISGGNIEPALLERAIDRYDTRRR
jgi:threonine dehydratase